jgi:hypothetical protein
MQSRTYKGETLILKWQDEPRRPRRRWRLPLPPRRRLVSLIVILLLLVGIPVLVVLGLRTVAQLRTVEADLTTASSELLDGVKTLQAGGSNIQSKDAARAAKDFSDAETRFARSRQYLHNNRVLHLLGILPPVGRQLSAADQLSDVGNRLARTGELGVQVVDVLLREQAIGPGSKKSPSERILATLSAVHSRLPAIQAELAAVRRDRAAIPSGGLLSPLQSAVHRLDAKFAEVDQAVTAVAGLEPGIAELLGANGARTYLVLQQDPAELRATGGFIGSIGFLSFDHGRMAPYRALDVYAIDRGATFVGDPGYVAPPAPLDSRIHPSSWQLRDANWSADFPTAAHQAASFYQKETGGHVDGVLAIDPYFMSQLLTLVGPVSVPETGDTLTPQNFFALTLANVNKDSGPGRKNFLSFAARPIFERLGSLPSAQWTPMLQTMLSSCQGRSLQASFNNASAQSVVGHFACDGRAAALTGDGVRVIDTNLGGNKDDFWLKRSFDLDMTLGSDASIEHTLTIHYDGKALVQNPRTGLYIDWIRVYLPPGSRLEQVSGASLSAIQEAGKPVVAGWMQLNYGQSLDVRLRYRTAPGNTPGEIRFYWQKQSGRVADPIAVHLHLPSGLRLRDVHVNGKSVRLQGTTIASDLAVDRTVLVSYQRS